jgi:four helix bundle protein
MRDPKKLSAFQLADPLAIAVYKRTGQMPPDERFGLTLQIRRAAVSVPSNIVEGCARNSESDYVRLLDMALGSACELEYQLSLALRRGKLQGKPRIARSEGELRRRQPRPGTAQRSAWIDICSHACRLSRTRAAPASHSSIGRSMPSAAKCWNRSVCAAGASAFCHSSHCSGVSENSGTMWKSAPSSACAASCSAWTRAFGEAAVSQAARKLPAALLRFATSWATRCRAEERVPATR